MFQLYVTRTGCCCCLLYSSIRSETWNEKKKKPGRHILTLECQSSERAWRTLLEKRNTFPLPVSFTLYVSKKRAGRLSLSLCVFYDPMTAGRVWYERVFHIHTHTHILKYVHVYIYIFFPFIHSFFLHMCLAFICLPPPFFFWISVWHKRRYRWGSSSKRSCSECWAGGGGKCIRMNTRLACVRHRVTPTMKK